MDNGEYYLSEDEYKALEYFQYNPKDINEIASSLQDDVDNPLEILNKLLAKGMLVHTEAKVVLDSQSTAYDLQKILSINNLPKTGSKKALIDRIIQNNLHLQEGVINKYNNVENITEIGEKAINLYESTLEKLDEEEHEHEEREKNEIFIRITNLYLSNKSKDAYKIAADYWKQKSDTTQYISITESDTRKLLASIERANPDSLSDLSITEINKFRAVAFAIILMNGEREISNIQKLLERYKLPDSIISINAITVRRITHILTNASYHRFKKPFENHTPKHFLFSVEYDDYISCELCRSLDKKTLTIDQFPEFPLRGCQCDDGCSINITAIFEEEETDEEDTETKGSTSQTDIQIIYNRINKIREQIKKISEKYKIIDCGLNQISSDLEKGIIDEVSAEIRLDELLNILDS